MLIATAQTLVLDLLPAMLQPEFDIVGCATDGAAAVRIALSQKLDIALLDLELPGLDGIGAGARICQMQSGIRIVYLAEDESLDRAARAFECDAAGYFLKAQPFEELLEALRAVARGRVYLSPAIAEGDVTKLRHAATGEPARTLSPREQDVLRLAAKGLAMNEIGRKLGISPRTVAFHKYRGMRALGLCRKADLVAFAMRQGLLSDE
jgi:DNA-binding NarL/FixJ family response regulator